MKRFYVLLTAVLFSLLACTTALAGEWVADGRGRRYDSGNATFAKDGWQWIDERFYYFGPDGYCLTGTTTPDGYTVDESGAWTLFGEVVERSADGRIADEETVIYQVGSLAMMLPREMVPLSQTDETIAFMMPDMIHAMSMMSFDSGGYSFSDADPQDILTLLDTFAEEFAGPGASRTPRQFSSGLWICYGCTTQLGDSSVPAKIYARISGSELQLVIFAGNSELSSVQDDMIMNLCVL